MNVVFSLPCLSLYSDSLFSLFNPSDGWLYAGFYNSALETYNLTVQDYYQQSYDCSFLWHWGSVKASGIGIVRSNQYNQTFRKCHQTRHSYQILDARMNGSWIINWGFQLCSRLMLVNAMIMEALVDQGMTQIQVNERLYSTWDTAVATQKSGFASFWNSYLILSFQSPLKRFAFTFSWTC